MSDTTNHCPMCEEYARELDKYRWRSVEDELPEPASEVLVYRPEQDCGLPDYTGAAEFWGRDGGWYAMDQSRLLGVTLWRPIIPPSSQSVDGEGVG